MRTPQLLRRGVALPLLLLAANALPAAEAPGTPFAVRNPHPTHLITVSGALPAGLHPQITAFYAPAAQADENCGYRDSSGRLEPFAADETPELVRADARFRAVIVADRYLPGPCRWRLDAIGYHLMGATGELAEGIVAYAQSAAAEPLAGPSSGTPAAPRLEIWCVSDAPGEPSCGPLALLARHFARSPRILERLPRHRADAPRAIALNANLSSIELDFHDLDVTAAE